MQQSLPRLFARPILFAHRGASLVRPENTLEAFDEALRLGATGLETDVWQSRDGVIVIDHDGVVKTGLRRRPIATFSASDLAERFPMFDELLRRTPTVIDISVDVKDPLAFGALSAAVTGVGRNPDSVWACHPDHQTLQGWRLVDPSINFVHSTKIKVIADSPERHARGLRDTGVRVCNMHWRDWSGGLVALYHRFEIACFAWGLTHAAEMTEMLRIGIDGLYADDVRLLVEVATAT